MAARACSERTRLQARFGVVRVSCAAARHGPLVAGPGGAGVLRFHGFPAEGGEPYDGGMRLRNRFVGTGLLLCSLFLGLGSLEVAAAERCGSYDSQRQVFWGDLHVHTGISMDAYIFQTRLRPSDAYRFARGEELRLAPLGPDGAGTTPLRIDRPLDFAAVTDHAASFGGVMLSAIGIRLANCHVCVPLPRYCSASSS